MAELSIIVPIYNVEKYLGRCIESILAQTYTDFELILVNDGSPDNCAEIMEQYAKKDGRIITIYQENRGVSAARNAGLKIAQGKYIGFVDPDDWISDCMYQIMVEEMESTCCDLVCCNWDSHHSGGEKIDHIILGLKSHMTKNEFISHLFDKPRTVGGSTWNKLFCKKKIKKYYDEHIKIGEDYLFLMDYCSGISKVSYCNEILYHVFEREDSITRENELKLVEGLEVAKRIVTLAAEVNGKIYQRAESDYLDSCYRLLELARKKNATIEYKQARNYFKQYLRKNFWGVMKNPEIYWKTKILYFYKLIIGSGDETRN